MKLPNCGTKRSYWNPTSELISLKRKPWYLYRSSYHSRSRSRKRSRSRSRRSRTRTPDKSKQHRSPPTNTEKKGKDATTPNVDNGKVESSSKHRSKSWSLPKDGERKSWSRSPKDIQSWKNVYYNKIYFE